VREDWGAPMLSLPWADRVHAAVLLVVAPGLIAAYWIAFFFTDWTRPDYARYGLAPGVYLGFESAFPLPDGFVAVTSALAGYYLIRRDLKAVLFGLLSAGGFMFLALIDTYFNILHHLYTAAMFREDPGMLVEAVINVACAAGAGWSARRLWIRFNTGSSPDRAEDCS